MRELNTFFIMAQAIVVVPVWWLTLTVICASHALLFASKCLHMLLHLLAISVLAHKCSSYLPMLGYIFCSILHIVWPSDRYLYEMDLGCREWSGDWYLKPLIANKCKRWDAICNGQERGRKQSKHVRPSLPISKFTQPFSFLYVSFTNIPTQIHAHEIAWRT